MKSGRLKAMTYLELCVTIVVLSSVVSLCYWGLLWFQGQQFLEIENTQNVRVRLQRLVLDKEMFHTSILSRKDNNTSEVVFMAERSSDPISSNPYLLSGVSSRFSLVGSYCFLSLEKKGDFDDSILLVSPEYHHSKYLSSKEGLGLEKINMP